MSTQTDTLHLIVEGGAYPLVRTMTIPDDAGNSHPYWILKEKGQKPGRALSFGVPFPVLADALPTRVTLTVPGGDTVEVALEPVLEQTIDGVKTPVTKPKVRGYSAVEVEGEMRNFSITMSDPQNGGDWNCVAKVTRKGGGKSSTPVRRANVANYGV